MNVADKKVFKSLDWYHVMKFGKVTSPGYFDWSSYINIFPLSSIAGKTVLDVGAGDGYFSFYMEKLGAKVTALDITNAQKTDNLTVVDKLAQRRAQGHTDTFSFAKKYYQSKVKRIRLNLYDISPKTVGMYDIVFCNDVLLHLTDPIRALKNFKSIALKTVIVGTPITASKENFIASYLKQKYLGISNNEYAIYTGDTGNGAFWMPTISCLENWLKTVGLTIESSKVIKITPSDMICSLPRGIVSGKV